MYQYTQDIEIVCELLELTTEEMAQEEKEYYLNSRKEFVEINRDKVKIARRQYRGKGKYIEEILQ